MTTRLNTIAGANRKRFCHFFRESLMDVVRSEATKDGKSISNMIEQLCLEALRARQISGI